MSVELAVLQQIKNKVRQAPVSIVNGCSTGIMATFGETGTYGASVTSVGALTANQLKTVLSLTGSGVLNIIAFFKQDTTQRIIRAKLTIDGIVVFNATSASNPSTNTGFLLIGVKSNPTTVSGLIPLPTYFNSSVLFEVSSSLTENANLTTAINYNLF